MPKKLRVVLVSGWGMKPDLLKAWADRFSSTMCVEVIDIPDVLAGQRLSSGDRAERLASQISSPSVCVGWSLGGSLLIDLAHYYPEVVSGLVLLGTNPCFVATDNWPGMDASLFHRFVNSFTDNPAKTMQRFASLQVTGSPDARSLLREVKAYLETPSPLLGELLLELAIDRRERLHHLSCPVLNILADNDELVPVSLQDHLNCELISASSHLIFLDQPSACASVVQTWLTEQGMLLAC